MYAEARGCVVHHVVRRDPSRSVVNRVLRAHVETFLARYVDEHGGRSLPAYVEGEVAAALSRFREHLTRVDVDKTDDAATSWDKAVSDFTNLGLS